MEKNLDTATPIEIANYLNHLWDIAWEKSEHKTDEEDGNENASNIWETLYNMVFSENISRKLKKRFGRLDYYDPDASYYRDVTAYIRAFDEFAKNYADSPRNMFPTFEEYSKE